MKKGFIFLLPPVLVAALIGVSFLGDELNEQRSEKTDNGNSVVLLMGSGTSTYFANSYGRTLYYYERDATGTSRCYDFCSAHWPPLVVSPDDHIDPSLPGNFGTLYRADGNIQMTYNGKPVHIYGEDEKEGDMKGEGAEKFWHILRP